MADTLAELREAVELAQKALDNELFNNDKPMTAPPFAGMLANVADQQAQLIAAQQQRIAELEAGLQKVLDIATEGQNSASEFAWLNERRSAGDDLNSDDWYELKLRQIRAITHNLLHVDAKDGNDGE